MICEPHLTSIPKATIAGIAHWCSESGSKMTTEVSSSLALPNESTQNWQDSKIAETIIWESERSLSGIYCASAESQSSVCDLVLLVNAGSVHSIGPNRTYTETARSLAIAGIDCLRFDLPNLGESVVSDAEDENSPYTAFAARCTSDVIDYAAKRWPVNRIILAGLCSGAYITLCTALIEQNKNLSALVMINPLTFYWEKGMPFRLGSGQVGIDQAKYYELAIGDKMKWRKFFSGQVDYVGILAFIARRFLQIVKSYGLYLLDRLGITAPTPLANQLRQIANVPITMHFIFSSRDPGYDLLKDSARSALDELTARRAVTYDFIENADHTFSNSVERHEFVTSFVSYVLDRTVRREGKELPDSP